MNKYPKILMFIIIFIFFLLSIYAQLDNLITSYVIGAYSAYGIVTEIGYITSDQLKILKLCTSGNLSANINQYAIITQSCISKDYISDGNIWKPCDSYDASFELEGSDYICTGTSTIKDRPTLSPKIRQWVECCPDGRCQSSTHGIRLLPGRNVTLTTNNNCPQGEFEIGKDELGNSKCVTLGRDCKDIKQNKPILPSGTYYIDPDGSGGKEPFEVWCDMEHAGGGWTLTFSSDAQDFNIDAAIPYTTSKSIPIPFINSNGRYKQLPSHTEEMFACTTDTGFEMKFATFNTRNEVWDQTKSGTVTLTGILTTSNGVWIDTGYFVDLGNEDWGMLSASSKVQCFSSTDERSNINAWFWHFVR